MAFGDLRTTPPQSGVAASTSISLTHTNAPTAGDLIVVVMHKSESGYPGEPTDDGTGVFKEIGEQYRGYDGSNGSYTIHYKIAAGDETEVVSPITASGDWIMFIYVIEGAWRADPLDVAARLGEQSTTAFDSGECPTNNTANAYAVCLMGGEPSNLDILLSSFVGGFTEDARPADFQVDLTFMGISHKLITAREAVRCQATWSGTNEDGIGVVAVFAEPTTVVNKPIRKHSGFVYG